MSYADPSLSDSLPKDWDKFLKIRDNKRKFVHLISEQFLVFGCNLLQSDQTLYVGGGFSESFITKQVTGSTCSIEICQHIYCNALEADSRV